MKRFKCKECGYVHIGDEAPSVCPVCGYDSEVFYEMEEESSSKEVDYYEMIDDSNLDIIKNLRHQFDSFSELAAVSMSMAKQAIKENKEEDAELFKESYDELLGQASLSAMLLGEFLEFNTESNKKELARKLQKDVQRSEELILLLENDGLVEYVDIIKNKSDNIKKIMDKLEK
ncbi:MAG: rubrerythrin [Peptostreptococcus sp.]|uniref:rubredoxin-like domain-containing protein n=1 Tax=Peptostreptococcus sp. TaxID=1262 RepID=UPI002FC85451